MIVINKLINYFLGKGMLIGLCGYKGVGKSTVANILVRDYNFQKFSFADSLKDSLSNIFGWDRDLLEGETEESRIFRESKDEWWSKKLGFEVIPRNMMTKVGTDMFREIVHKDIWVLSLENKIKDLLEKDEKVVISDYRYSDNEYLMIKNYNGIIVRVNDGNIPEYEKNVLPNNSENYMKAFYPNVHSSEYSFLCKPFDYVIDNLYENGVRDQEKLEKNIFLMMKLIYN